MKRNIIRVSDKYIRSLIREAIGNTPDMPVSKDVETTGKDNGKPLSENGGQLRLSESQLREFVSYSVARLLRESRYLRAEEYGPGEMEIELDPWTGDFDRAVEETMREAGLDEDWLDDRDPFPVTVKVRYTVSPGSGRDYTLDLPGSPDEPEVTGWEIMTPPDDPETREFVEKAVSRYMDGTFNLEDELIGKGMLREDSDSPLKGHFVGGLKPKDGPESKYKKEDGSYLTWDEYKRNKEEEFKKSKEKKGDLNPVLRGGKGGSFGGNRKSDGKRKDESRVRLTSGDISEMVTEAVEKVIKGLNGKAY